MNAEDGWTMTAEDEAFNAALEAACTDAIEAVEAFNARDETARGGWVAELIGDCVSQIIITHPAEGQFDDCVEIYDEGGNVLSDWASYDLDNLLAAAILAAS